MFLVIVCIAITLAARMKNNLILTNHRLRVTKAVPSDMNRNKLPNVVLTPCLSEEGTVNRKSFLLVQLIDININ